MAHIVNRADNLYTINQFFINLSLFYKGPTGDKGEKGMSGRRGPKVKNELIFCVIY